MKRILSMLLVVIMLFGTLCVLTACGEPKDDGAEISVYLGDEVFDFDPTSVQNSHGIWKDGSLVKLR